MASGVGIVLLADVLFGPGIMESRVKAAIASDREYRVTSDAFHHTLAPNYSSDNARWGSGQYAIRTNSLGFKDALVRTVDKVSNRRRVVFIGDSFTEGLGFRFEDTFVGRYAAAHPDREVLNAAVSSYSPAIYLRKLRWLIAQGYAFDEAVIYIDISDIQDEGFTYSVNPQGDLDPEYRGCEWFTVFDYLRAQGRTPVESPGARLARAIDNRLPLTSNALTWLQGRVGRGTLRQPLRSGLHATVGLIKGAWTYAPRDLPCYGPGGVDEAIATAQRNMTELAALLTSHGIRFSVGVYAWPDQLANDVVNSAQVQIWQTWCREHGCEAFINHFPDFFARKTEAAYPPELFVPGDIHFNAEGHRLMAERLNQVLVRTP